MQNQFKIYCFIVYTQLNMFRALLCPSSEAPSNCLCSLWFPYDCRVGHASSCGRFTSKLCFGHCCAHHQEPPPITFAASGYRMIAGLNVLRAVVGLLVRLTSYSSKHVQPGNHTVTRGCKGSWRGLLKMGMLSGVYATKQ
jgi:hypothetical protein